MSKYPKWFWPSMGGFGVICSLAILVSCSVGDSKKKVEEVPSPAPVVEQPNAEQALDAMFRSHPHAKRVCYDKSNDTYLFDNGPDLEPNTEDDGFIHGSWMSLPDQKFVNGGNGTWMSTADDSSKWTEVYPDYSNMPCKTR